MDINIATLNGATVEVVVNRITNAEAVWISPEYSLPSDETAAPVDSCSFCDRFAYGISDTAIFSHLEFTPDDRKIQTVERYGGAGVGVNGGGGRTTNDGAFQLKGSGKNCMVGDGVASHHGYGGLDAPNAIAETIYSNILAKLLPIGTLKVHGLILTGENAGVYGIEEHLSQQCWGVILVRDACLRPAHFLRAGHFKPQPQFKGDLLPDAVRARLVNQDLKKALGGDDQFVKMLGRFLFNCANQFAFARVARICHGALSPSNIALDGRWLDLPIASFLSGGVNYCRVNPFYAEAAIPLTIVDEMAYTYSKYNGVNLNVAPLLNYYRKQFDEYYNYHIGFLFAISQDTLADELKQTAWLTLAKYARQVLESGQNIGAQQSHIVFNDPVICFIEGVFLSLADKNAAHEKLAGILAAADCDSLFAAAATVFSSVFENSQHLSGSYRQFVICSALRAIKKSRLSSLFYSTTLDVKIQQAMAAPSHHAAAALIDAYNDLAGWIFQPDAERDIVVFKNEFCAVTYLPAEPSYQLLLADGETCSFAGILNLLTYMGSHDMDQFLIGGFGVGHYVSSLLEVVVVLESASLQLPNER